MPIAKQGLSEHVPTNTQRQAMDVFSVSCSDKRPYEYNQKLRPDRQSGRDVVVRNSGSRQSKVIARKELDCAKKT
jgi:hypothetical protein